MKKYKLTNDGKKALDARKSLNENQRLPSERMIKLTGRETFHKCNGILWEVAKGKNNKSTVKRQLVLRDILTKKK
ncbi:MAG TPA: hypothetical protein VJ571_05515 [Candidatus Nitrosotalea sp.]|nr:hypothetical protein [Candidatus Nitrosotalea sp.]